MTRPEPAQASRGVAHVVDTDEQLQAFTHRARRRILDALREPDSAAAVARRLDEPRQRINHHVQELAKVGLLHKAGERRRGNFVEQLYRSAGPTVVLSSRLTWGDTERRQEAMAAQASLGNLVRFGEQVRTDAAILLDRAVFDGADIPSAAVQASVRLPDAAACAAFLDDYLGLVRELVERYSAPDAPAYTVGFVTYPAVDDRP